VSAARSALAVQVAGLAFQNPIVLAAGTAAYGHELADIVDLPTLGGLVTKAVSPEPRAGAPAPRVAEFDGGMINAVGLANPGVSAVRREHLPWLARSLPSVRKLANVVGFGVGEFAAVIEQLELSLEDESRGALDGYEINVSCPNVKAGGMEFGADRAALTAVVTGVRRETRRPVFVKLSPTLESVGDAARVAADAGADGISVVNTIPGLLIDVERRRPVLGFGTGGVSGPAILPVGVLATWKVRKAVPLPILGVGGVSSAEDALQYIMAGAALVGVGTAAMRDPRAPERIVRDLEQWCARHNVNSVEELVGALEWPS
jgi:dihydroorotate dehydrogenase (NAD+) catalytic subunit